MSRHRYNQSAEDDRHLVYWLYDHTCVSPKRDGYIGSTSRGKRIVRSLKRFQATKFKILFRGSREACLALENKLRPKPHIGWNTDIGGFKNGKGGANIPKSKLHRQRISKAARARYKDPAEHAKTSKAVRAGLKNIDRTGPNNPMFGRQHSAATKHKISLTKKRRHD